MSKITTQPDPNCTIAVTVYDINTAPRFSYSCTRRSSGWRVQPDGSIHPPPKQRIVKFHLRFPAGSNIMGFQVARKDDQFPPRDQEPWNIDPASGVQPLDPVTWPPSSSTGVTELTFDFTGAGGLLKYQMGVDGNWDDPKIYDDGSE